VKSHNTAQAFCSPLYSSATKGTFPGLTRRRFASATLADCRRTGAVASEKFSRQWPYQGEVGHVAPKGSSYYKHLQAMGEKWRAVPSGVSLTIYRTAVWAARRNMVRRMRLGNCRPEC